MDCFEELRDFPAEWSKMSPILHQHHPSGSSQGSSSMVDRVSFLAFLPFSLFSFSWRSLRICCRSSAPVASPSGISFGTRFPWMASWSTDLRSLSGRILLRVSSSPAALSYSSIRGSSSSIFSTIAFWMDRGGRGISNCSIYSDFMLLILVPFTISAI